ncbi:MBL fold metallo-hydrolase [Leucothrix sargassi]|nr:MBL fold metallo-hydrolase [Leucothrix sargassi]
MSKKVRYSLIVLLTLLLTIAGVAFWASKATSTRHAATLSPLGQASTREALVDSLKNGERVTFNVATSANFTVPLGGLLNLEDPKAKQAGLVDEDTQVQIFAYHIRHPKHGDFLIDSGVSQKFMDAPDDHGVPSLMLGPLGFDTLEMLKSTESIISDFAQPLQGVFISHLHVDHIMGLPAIAPQVPVYVGRGETVEPFILFAMTRGIVDRLLEGRPDVREWSAQYVDVFGDGSVFAIHSPGHTAGSTAYLVNSTAGSVLLVGDASHTKWGWENGVEPGAFSINQPLSRLSLERLRKLVEENPSIQVRPGHQAL